LSGIVEGDFEADRETAAPGDWEPFEPGDLDLDLDLDDSTTAAAAEVDAPDSPDPRRASDGVGGEESL
jgi:hypothetical protein